MNQTLVRALGCAALLAAAGCRSAFAPDPVLRLSSHPATDAPATVTRDTPIRSGPDRLAKVLDQIAAGTAVQASGQPVRGFVRVRTADGRSGYVEQGAVSMGEAAAPAPQAAPAAPAP